MITSRNWITNPPCDTQSSVSKACCVVVCVQGRLCQRSLMNAEGPTYDARGAVVLAAYRPRSLRARKFPQTRAPRLLLPRCCNCCKKSVLGCM